MTPSQLLQQGIAAIQAGQKKEAQALLAQLVKTEPHNSQAWLWLAAAVDQKEQRRYCLRRTLALDPVNSIARQALAQVAEPPPPLPPSPSAPPSPAAPIAPAQTSTPAIRSGSKVLLIAGGCCLLLVIGLLLLFLPPTLSFIYQARQAAEQNIQQVMFTEVMQNYYQDYPKNDVPLPYINGKAVAMDADTGMLHPLHNLLPDEIQATDPAEIGTLFRLECSLNGFEISNGPLLPYRRNLCEIEVIDLAIPAVIASNFFAGEKPAEFTVVNMKKLEEVGFENIEAALDNDTFLEWLARMPVIGSGGVERKTFCAAATLERFQQLELNPRSTLADAVKEYAVQKRCLQGQCDLTKTVSQAQWTIKESRIGCNLALNMSIKGQVQSPVLFVIALPSQKVYAASNEVVSVMQRKASANPIFNPFWKTLELPAQLP